jgi:hypothetical protein
VPRFCESEEDEPTLLGVLDSLIPFLKDRFSPSSLPPQLPSYFGSTVINLTHFNREVNTLANSQAENTKESSWSRGTAIERSPIKTRISKKSSQAQAIFSTILDPSSSDSGALRAVKALARAK